MTWNEIIAYFSKDPLRVLAVLGGGGGLLYWYDRYKNRARLRINIINLGLISPDSSNKVCIQFEIENLGILPNSIEHSVSLSGITPKCLPNSTGERHTFSYMLKDTDRNLPPNSPISFKACADWDEQMRFIWFIKVKFTVTRGRGVTIFIRSFSNERLSWLKYMYERIIKYGLFNRLNSNAS